MFVLLSSRTAAKSDLHARTTHRKPQHNLLEAPIVVDKYEAEKRYERVGLIRPCRAGSGWAGSGRVGSGWAGSGRARSDRVGLDQVGSGQVGRVGLDRLD